MTRAEEIAAAKAQSHWTAKQRNHLRRLQQQGATIAFWNSDAHGRPANHAMEPLKARAWTARPGLVQEVAGPLQTCSQYALHATFEPHRWAGARVWVVGLVGEVRRDADSKCGALRREIVGEVLPEEVVSPSVGVRIGRRDLRSADLRSADLRSADLRSADLRSADLRSADLRSADLRSADLYGANLYGANLYGANLYGANLYGANLYGADLRSANLYGADLYGADLRSADLYGADLGGCYWPKSQPPPSGWTHDPPVADCSWVVLRRAP